ncbi:hypothetical protein BDZ89DRAFT_1055201 [Hymenopellis radicata]|nr:hypothetical protein BDZ89DRAFT_1055201 [Hymenopellis radicata]
MKVQPVTVLLAYEHKLQCIVGGDIFSEALDVILKARVKSQISMPMYIGRLRSRLDILSGLDNNVLPENAVVVAMDDVVDVYEPAIVWFGSAWDTEPTGVVWSKLVLWMIWIVWASSLWFGFGKTCFAMMNLSPKLSDLAEVSDDSSTRIDGSRKRSDRQKSNKTRLTRCRTPGTVGMCDETLEGLHDDDEVQTSCADRGLCEGVIGYWNSFAVINTVGTFRNIVRHSGGLVVFCGAAIVVGDICDGTEQSPSPTSTSTPTSSPAIQTPREARRRGAEGLLLLVSGAAAAVGAGRRHFLDRRYLSDVSMNDRVRTSSFISAFPAQGTQPDLDLRREMLLASFPTFPVTHIYLEHHSSSKSDELQADSGVCRRDERAGRAMRYALVDDSIRPLSVAWAKVPHNFLNRHVQLLNMTTIKVTYLHFCSGSRAGLMVKSLQIRLVLASEWGEVPDSLIGFNVWRRRGYWFDLSLGLRRPRVDLVVHGWWRDGDVKMYVVLGAVREKDGERCGTEVLRRTEVDKDDSNLYLGYLFRRALAGKFPTGVGPESKRLPGKGIQTAPSSPIHRRISEVQSGAKRVIEIALCEVPSRQNRLEEGCG